MRPDRPKRRVSTKKRDSEGGSNIEKPAVSTSKADETKNEGTSTAPLVSALRNRLETSKVREFISFFVIISRF